MDKMSGAYLQSGESIILTTDRVRVNSVQYDVLLTTRQLLLVDAGHTLFHPTMYPLLSILSVKGGRTANGELVISIFFNETIGKDDIGPMILVFSQQPGEQRKNERDDWIKKLMKLIVSVRQETNTTGSSPPDQHGGIRPSLRRIVAPEMPRPYKTSPNTRQAQVELIIIPDEPELPVIIEDAEPEVIPETHAELVIAAEHITESLDILPPPLHDNEETSVDADTVPGSPFTQAPALQDIEETTGDADTVPYSPVIPSPALQDTEETTGDAERVTESSEVSILHDVSKTDAITDTPEENEGTGIIPETSPLKEIPVFTLNDTGYSDLPLPMEQGVAGSSQDTYEEASEPSGSKSFHADDVQVSFLQPVADATPPLPETSSQAMYPGSRRRTFIAVTAILIIFLVIAGAGVYYSAHGPPPPGVGEPALTPTLSLQQTPVTLVPTPIIIPATGIWVRVVYPGNFYGWLGTPGSLRAVNSSGDQVYKLPESAETIQVNMYKQDNSGNPLAVKVYREGKIINNRTISVPMGAIELLMNAKTGVSPGLSPTVTPSVNQTGSDSGRIMYF